MGVTIDDTFAEAFGMSCARLVVTAVDAYWLDIAVREVTGYGTSVIGCDAEAGLEQPLTPAQTPDGRVGASILFFAFSSDKLAAALVNRVGQCLMTCPTTAVFDGLPDAGQLTVTPVAQPDQPTPPAPLKTKTSGGKRLEVGGKLRFFGDGYQKSKLIQGRRYWRIPVMDGEFVVQEDVGCVKAIAGGNMLLCGPSQMGTLHAAKRAVDAMAKLPDVITPFPGGVVRSGSKVGSKYKGMFASSNDAFCPTLRSKVATQLPEGASCVYEIVVNGLSAEAIIAATKAGIDAACEKPDDLSLISAGNYGGKLGKFHFKLYEVLGLRETTAGGAS